MVTVFALVSYFSYRDINVRMDTTSRQAVDNTARLEEYTQDCDRIDVSLTRL